MKRMLVPAVLAFVLLLSSCGEAALAGDDGRLGICRLAAGKNGLYAYEAIELRDGESLSDAAVRGLNQPPAVVGLESALPGGLKVLGVGISDGRARVELSREYDELSEIEKTVARFAVADTFFGLDEVCYVDVVCSSRVVAYGITPGQAVGSDMLEGGESVRCKLFLPDEENGCLRPVTEEIEPPSDGDLSGALVQRLLERAEGISGGTRLVSSMVSSGVCTVNLSEEFFATEPESKRSAELVIASIVDTLTFLPKINCVIIRVSGVAITGYGGYTASWPAEFDGEIIDFQE